MRINNLNTKICSNCVMDTTDSKISFDKNGVCDHCRIFYSHIKPNWHPDDLGKIKLQYLVERIIKKAKGRDFDCILGISGGIDSSYLLHVVVSEFGLKPLVFHVDAGWNSQIAVNNIERLIDKLNLDLFTDVIDWEEIKDLQVAFFKSGVPHIDVPQDHAFFASMYKYASKYKIKYILTGGNYSTECVRNPLEWMYYQSDSVQLKDIHNRFGTKPLKKYPITNILWHKLYLPYFMGVKVVRPLDYVPYNKDNALKFLVKNYDFQSYPQKHFESRFTRFYESYWLPRRFGYDVRKVQFSSLILSDQMTRDDAMEKLKQQPFDQETANKEFEFVANKLSLTNNELQEFFELPLKNYRDYKSQELIYRIGSTLFKKFGLERGGKR